MSLVRLITIAITAIAGTTTTERSGKENGARRPSHMQEGGESGTSTKYLSDKDSA